MTKCIENATEEELKELLPDIPYEIVEIVYGYYHRGRMSVTAYTIKCSISSSTLYRYIKVVKTAYDKRVR